MTKRRLKFLCFLHRPLAIGQLACIHLKRVLCTGDRTSQILVLETVPNAWKSRKSVDNVGSLLRKDCLLCSVLKRFTTSKFFKIGKFKVQMLDKIYMSSRSDIQGSRRLT